MPSRQDNQPPSDDDMPMVDAPAESPIHEEEDPNPTNIAFGEQRIRIVSFSYPPFPCPALSSVHRS